MSKYTAENKDSAIQLRESFKSALLIYKKNKKMFSELNFSSFNAANTKIKALQFRIYVQTVTWESLKFEMFDIGLQAAKSLDVFLTHIRHKGLSDYINLLHDISYLLLVHYRQIPNGIVGPKSGWRKSAYQFYKKHGYQHSRILSHMRGIDFNKPVKKQTINIGTALYQYQAACFQHSNTGMLISIKNKINQGDYYSLSRSLLPDNLGINSHFLCRICKKIR